MLLVRRRRSVAAFTLPELMAVIAIIGVMTAIAMATMSRSGDAENAASLARSLHGAIMNARTATLSDGFMRRLKCTLQTDGSNCFVERAGAPGMNITPAAWTTAGGLVSESRINAGTHATLWNVTLTNDATTNNAGSAQVTGTKFMYLKPDGTVCDTYATTGCTSLGFTFYVNDTSGGSTAANRYKIYVYAITGMPRLVNAW